MTISTGVFFLAFEQLGEVIADVAGALGRDDVVDVAPFLRPHIAEQVGADRAGRGLDRIAVFLVELGPRVAVELVVERLHLAHSRSYIAANSSGVMSYCERHIAPVSA